MTRTIVAIDGPAGAGKSTAAKLVASRLGLAHIDTGATYRLLALRALVEDVPLDGSEQLAALASRVAGVTTLGPDGRLVFDGAPVGDDIRTPEVTRAASHVAAHPEVRAVLVQLQRSLVPAGGAVVEGRDIGTVVWPDAQLKVYLDAAPEVRAERRAEDAPAAVTERDARDAARPVGAMRPADDAVHIDTSQLAADAVAEAILDRVPRPVRAHAATTRMSLFYRFARGALALILKPWRFEVIGRDRIPAAGPVILAPNHRSLIDIPVAGVASKRQVYFMAKEELFKSSVAAALLRRLGAFPVRRGRPDREPLTRALALLRAGEMVGIFPEGTRRAGSRFEEIEEGLAYVALKSGATVVPLAISGTDAVFPPGRKLPKLVRIRALVGEPFTLGGPVDGLLPRSRVRAASAEAHRRLVALIDELEPR